MSIYIAIDIGGTQMRAAAFPSEGYQPITVQRVPTQNPDVSPREILVELIKSVCPANEEITSIGLAAPGPLNPKTGVIFTAPNIPAFQDFPIVEYLQSKFSVPVFLDNDANLAALGEWKAGAGQGHDHLIYLTISTGIGSGIITDGRLLHGAQGIAAELGHVTVIPDGPMCGCGHRGHLEAIASGKNIARWTKKQLAKGAESSLHEAKKVTAKTIAKAARKGDQLALKAYRRAGAYIGLTLANFLHSFNPSMVIFGGGVSLSGDLLLEPVRQSVKEHVMNPKYAENLVITTAALGDDAGMIGALILARTTTEA